MLPQLKQRSSWDEWKQQHCRFNIGELDNLTWIPYFQHEIEASYIKPDASPFTMYFRHTLSERLVRCTQDQVAWCFERCPYGLDSFKIYFKGEGDDGG